MKNGRDQVGEIVLELIQNHVGKTLPLQPDSPLFAGGLELDSVAFLELILKLEKRLGLRLRDEDLTEEALDSVGDFARHVEAIYLKRA